MIAIWGWLALAGSPKEAIVSGKVRGTPFAFWDVLGPSSGCFLMGMIHHPSSQKN